MFGFGTAVPIVTGFTLLNNDDLNIALRQTIRALIMHTAMTRLSLMNQFHPDHNTVNEIKTKQQIVSCKATLCNLLRNVISLFGNISFCVNTTNPEGKITKTGFAVCAKIEPFSKRRLNFPAFLT